MIAAWHRQFEQRFGPASEVRVYRAPGRVNLIGEHTDYNLGFVLPVALQLATYIAAAPSADGKLRIYSEDRKEEREFDPASLGTIGRAGQWTDYPVGVAQELVRAGIEIPGVNLLIRSTVPEGSGLSSSAALEVASALAYLGGRPIEKLELAKLCQRAERNFVGMPCGIMDQYISVFGRAGSAVEIDCRSLGNRLVTLPVGVTFIAVNSMVKHEHSGSAYRDRVRECAEAVAALKAEYPAVESLRDASLAQLRAVSGNLDEVVARRARHIITENDRVNAFVAASAAGDIAALGRLMVESHRSMQYDYQISCQELDFLVDAALGIEGVHGSRMTGGGFGGCTVTMVARDAAAGFRAAISREYVRKFGITPKIYACDPADGAGEVKNFEVFPGALI
jgi:galactokinase